MLKEKDWWMERRERQRVGKQGHGMSLLALVSLVKVKRKIPLHPRRRTASSRNDLLLLWRRRPEGGRRGRSPNYGKQEAGSRKKKQGK